MLFQCCATGIMWSAGGRLILLPTYVRRVLVTFALRLSAPARIRYTDLLFSTLEDYGLLYTPRLSHCHATGIMWSARRALILLPTYTSRVLMESDFVCVCSCENKVLRLAYSTDGSDLTDTVLVLSLASSVLASGVDSLMCSL